MVSHWWSVFLLQLTIVITCCCIKSKGSYSHSTTGPGPPVLYEIPVSISGVSSLEMKDNMACGHLTIGTSGNIPTITGVYDTVTMQVL